MISFLCCADDPFVREFTNGEFVALAAVSAMTAGMMRANVTDGSIERWELSSAGSESTPFTERGALGPTSDVE
ncbi:hypothetical protein [Halomontanus rarus]|uniref:hypothetical protein n=1 Tax=Halomontanus rarus TaxID=3034020 RepID=UPI0023E7CFB1|nr:hypothetical protein [Halovivax sp. TS33]